MEQTRREEATALLPHASTAGDVLAALADGGNAREVTSDGHSVFHLLRFDSEEVARTLLTLGGADPNAHAPCSCASVLQTCIARGLLRTVHVLLEHGARPDLGALTAVLGLERPLKWLLRDLLARVEPEHDAEYAQPLLERAVGDDATWAVEVLLARFGPPVRLESTVLSPDTATALLDGGMDPDAPVGNLHLAHIFCSSPEYLAELQRRGADMTTASDKAGITALHITASAAAARFLVEQAGVPVDIPTRRDGKTPMLTAVRAGRYAVAQELLRLGADPHVANRRGQSAVSCLQEQVARAGSAPARALLLTIDATPMEL